MIGKEILMSTKQQETTLLEISIYTEFVNTEIIIADSITGEYLTQNLVKTGDILSTTVVIGHVYTISSNNGFDFPDPVGMEIIDGIAAGTSYRKVKIISKNPRGSFYAID